LANPVKIGKIHLRLQFTLNNYAMNLSKFAVLVALAPLAALSAQTQTLTFASGVPGNPYVNPTVGLTKFNGDYVDSSLTYNTSFAGKLKVTSFATTKVTAVTQTRASTSAPWGSPVTGPTTKTVTSALVIQDLAPSKGGLGVEFCKTGDNSPNGDNVGFKSTSVVTNPTNKKKVTTTTTVAETLDFRFDKATSLQSIMFNGDHTTVGAGTFDLNFLGLDNLWHDQSFNLASVVNFSNMIGTEFKIRAENQHFYVSGMVVSAVPEPESLALMLAGLGVVGAIARRRAAKLA
jgi:hypothetical protein